MSRRPAAAVSVTLLVIVIGLCSAGCGVPGASGEARPAGPVTVYVANCGSDTVTAADNRPSTPIKVGHGPDGIAITPDGKIAYVANDYSGTVTPIWTASNTTERPIKVGRGPGPIAVVPSR